MVCHDLRAHFQTQLLHMSAAFLDLPQGFLKHLIEPFLMRIAVLLRLQMARAVW